MANDSCDFAPFFRFPGLIANRSHANFRRIRRSNFRAYAGRIEVLLVAAIAVLLLVCTTVMHYELLRALTFALPSFGVPARAKLLVVIFSTFLAHAAEILLYAVAMFALVRHFGLGALGASRHVSFSASLYFSAETYTSLGYGDVVPSGDLRLLAGLEALNGLLLIGWSASYTYIAMERFWNGHDREKTPAVFGARAEARRCERDAPEEVRGQPE